jgi:hypothetical protein
MPAAARLISNSGAAEGLQFGLTLAHGTAFAAMLAPKATTTVKSAYLIRFLIFPPLSESVLGILAEREHFLGQKTMRIGFLHCLRQLAKT